MTHTENAAATSPTRPHFTRRALGSNFTVGSGLFVATGGGFSDSTGRGAVSAASRVTVFARASVSSRPAPVWARRSRSSTSPRSAFTCASSRCATGTAWQRSRISPAFFAASARAASSRAFTSASVARHASSSGNLSWSSCASELSRNACAASRILVARGQWWARTESARHVERVRAGGVAAPIAPPKSFIQRAAASKTRSPRSFRAISS